MKPIIYISGKITGDENYTEYISSFAGKKRCFAECSLPVKKPLEIVRKKAATNGFQIMKSEAFNRRQV